MTTGALRRKVQSHESGKALAVREEACRILGVDLTIIPGVSVLHVQNHPGRSSARTSQNSVALVRSVAGWSLCEFYFAGHRTFLSAATARQARQKTFDNGPNLV